MSVFLLFSPKLLKLQERVLSGVVLHLLGDEDPRVRHVAAASLVRYLLDAFPSIHVSGESTSCYENGKRGRLRGSRAVFKIF